MKNDVKVMRVDDLEPVGGRLKQAVTDKPVKETPASQLEAGEALLAQMKADIGDAPDEAYRRGYRKIIDQIESELPALRAQVASSRRA